jgi:hypothetical protein
MAWQYWQRVERSQLGEQQREFSMYISMIRIERSGRRDFDSLVFCAHYVNTLYSRLGNILGNTENSFTISMGLYQTQLELIDSAVFQPLLCEGLIEGFARSYDARNNIGKYPA